MMKKKDDAYINWVVGIAKARGGMRIWDYFLDVVKTDFFENFVKKTRKKYNIPRGGFGRQIDEFDYPNGAEAMLKLRQDVIKNVCKKHGLPTTDYATTIVSYIYYDKLAINPYSGLFRISEKDIPFEKSFRDEDAEFYPIAIRISQYASKRDLLRFIAHPAIWSEIQSLQNNHKKDGVKIGKIKTRKRGKQFIKDIIYKNRNMPKKELASLISKEYGISIDYGYVGKIISLEKKGRGGATNQN